MPINKFGLSFVGKSESHYQWRRLLRNYMRYNALCIVAVDFDAKSREIRRLALSVDNADAANDMQWNVQDLKDHLNEIERKIAALQNNVQVMLNKFEKMIRDLLVDELHAPAKRNFSWRTLQYTDMMIWRMWSRCVLTRCITLNPLFFSQKNTLFFPRKQKQIYSKYLPSLTIHFSHLSGNLCILRQKNSSSFEANHSSRLFGRLHKNRNAAQRTRGSSTKTGDSQKVPGLVSRMG